jgi:DNA-binding NtrC family response regulator
VTGEAMELLWRYDWPGNVRELRNAIERAIVICGGSGIAVEDLPEPIRALAAPELEPEASGRPAPVFRDVVAPDELADRGLKPVIQQVEAELILRILRQTSFNRVEAARRLKLPLRTLSHKMKLYGLRPVDLAVQPV